MAMQASERGFRMELLGESFTPDEMGRMQGMLVARQELTNNGPEVFRSAVGILLEIKERNEAKKGDLASQLAFIRRKSKTHKGSEDQV